jgi:hypothetical protein
VSGASRHLRSVMRWGFATDGARFPGARCRSCAVSCTTSSRGRRAGLPAFTTWSRCARGTITCASRRHRLSTWMAMRVLRTSGGSGCRPTDRPSSSRPLHLPSSRTPVHQPATRSHPERQPATRSHPEPQARARPSRALWVLRAEGLRCRDGLSPSPCSTSTKLQPLGQERADERGVRQRTGSTAGQRPRVARASSSYRPLKSPPDDGSGSGSPRDTGFLSGGKAAVLPRKTVGLSPLVGVRQPE